MAINQTQNNNQSEDFISLKELASLYISNWYWFALSLFVCLTIAIIYLVTTPPVYTRYASVLIKQDSKGRTASTDLSKSISDLGMIRTRTNVDNEIINFRSPNLMFEVVKRLHLDIDYKTDGAFYKRTLYGDQLPINVTFDGLKNNESAGVTIKLKGDGNAQLSDFILHGDDVSGKPVTLKIGSQAETPIGKVTVKESPYKNKKKNGFKGSLYITRSSLYGATNAYRSRLGVQLTNEDATVIDLIFQDVNIQRAQEVLNTIINVYNEIWIEDKNQILTSTNEFINERLKVIQSELGTVDNDITSYKSANMIPDLEASAGMAMQQSANEGKHIMELNNQLNIARYLQGFIRSANNQLLPANAGLEEHSIQSMINSFNESQLQRNRLVESSSEENLLVKDLDQRLSSLKTTILNSIDNYIAALNMQLSASRAAQSQANARISSNPKQAGQLLSSERQQKVKESLYLFLLQKREENELSQAFTAYNTRVIATPELGGSMKPTSPKRRNTMMLAFALGLLIPGALIYLRESMNTTVRGRRDLDNMKTPFVGEIPLAYRKTTKEQITGIKARVLAMIPTKVKERLKLVEKKEKKQTEKAAPEIIVKANSRNIINEAFRVLRTNIEFMQGKNTNGHIIMFTSANPNSGKTFISANLSTAMAIKKKKVLVVDLDLRKKSLSDYFGQPKIGISDYLSGQVDDYRSLIVHHVTEEAQLDVIPVGTLPPNPAELLADPQLEQMLNELRSDYDYIFLDCPPIEIVTDADIINKYTDSTLFVVRAGLLERSMLAQIDNLYATQKYKSMAIILNGTDGGGHYGYKYGYKYGYSSKGYNYGN